MSQQLLLRLLRQVGAAQQRHRRDVHAQRLPLELVTDEQAVCRVAQAARDHVDLRQARDGSDAHHSPGRLVHLAHLRSHRARIARQPSREHREQLIQPLATILADLRQQRLGTIE